MQHIIRSEKENGNNTQITKSKYHHTLIPDEGNTFFFDHPVDHIPGMLLLDGFLSLIEYINQDKSKVISYYISNLHVNFLYFCDKEKIQLEARIVNISENYGVIKYGIKAIQNGVITCDGIIELTYSSSVRNQHSENIKFGNICYAPTEMVHKLRADNVFISNLKVSAKKKYYSWLLPISPKHCLYKKNNYSTLELIEACRQFTFLYYHTVHKIPTGQQVIFLSLNAKFRKVFSRNEMYYITPVNKEPERVKENIFQTVELNQQDMVVGELEFEGRIAPPKLYERIRKHSHKKIKRNCQCIL